jgi:hypothetical protein
MAWAMASVTVLGLAEELVDLTAQEKDLDRWYRRLQAQ